MASAAAGDSPCTFLSEALGGILQFDLRIHSMLFQNDHLAYLLRVFIRFFDSGAAGPNRRNLNYAICRVCGQKEMSSSNPYPTPAPASSD